MRLQLCALGLLLTLTGSIAAQPEPATSAPALQSSGAGLQQILEHMEAVQTHNPARFRPYVLTRQYRFYQADAKELQRDPKSEVLAEVSFTPPNMKTFDILETHGSGRGASVVKHMLEGESELSKDIGRNEISRANYNFTLLGESTADGRHCYILGLAPKREDHTLFKGRAFIDAENFHILRVEGQPAKSPSWWLKSSYVVLRFAEVAGLWLPVATEGTGEVRIFGRFTLASQKVDLRLGDEIAQARTESRPSRHRPHPTTAVGAAVLPQ